MHTDNGYICDPIFGIGCGWKKNETKWIETYRFQNRIYGNPCLRPNFPKLRFQRLLNADHKFFCKRNRRQWKKKIWWILWAWWWYSILFVLIAEYNTEYQISHLIAASTYVYASKSPLFIASMSCSVILMISCRRAKCQHIQQIQQYEIHVERTGVGIR